MHSLPNTLFLESLRSRSRAEPGLDRVPDASNTTSVFYKLYWCCVPDICPNNYSCVLTAHERKRDNIIIPVRIRTYKIMPLVLKLGKSSYPLPPEKNLERPPRASECTNRAETYIVDQCVRPGFSRPSTSCFAEKCWYEEKSWQKYENLTNVRIHMCSELL